MASGQERFIAQLEQAAKRADIMSRDEIASLFRRAARRLRNVSSSTNMDAEYEQLIDEMNQEPDHPAPRGK